MKNIALAILSVGMMHLAPKQEFLGQEDAVGKWCLRYLAMAAAIATFIV